MSILYVLALFTLLTISSVTYFASKRIKVPYTVLLVAIGLALVPLSKLPSLDFLNEFKLTPELLFYIFLPILIFESAYNIKVRKVQENIWSISLLSIVSLLISAFFSAGVLYFVFQFINISVPFIVLLIFGSLISATDPVAVLSLFKEYGAPRRLSLIFEGESLFNDGTAVALFFVVLAVALEGFKGISSVGSGILLFTTMVVGGIIFGLFMGGIFSKLIQWTRSNEGVSIMLMMVLAHLTFILSELISEHLSIAGYSVKLSSIIATTVASMMIGNYARYKIAPRAEEFVERFWGQFAFIANSLVFILIGLLFSTLPFKLEFFILPIIITVVVVATGRALSVYPVVILANKLKVEEPIPLSWQHLLAWGSLRGALAITMVLLIPDQWLPAGWSNNFTPKEFILALTIGCIYATLFIKAISIGPLIKRLGIDKLNRVEEVEYKEAIELTYRQIFARLDDFLAKGYVDKNSHDSLKGRYEKYLRALRGQSVKAESNLAALILRIHAIGIEKYFLRELYVYGEVNERVMRRLMTKLDTQLSYLEKGSLDFDPNGKDKKDWFEQLASLAHKIIPLSEVELVKEKYMYYRAKAIVSRKVGKVLREIQDSDTEHFFDNQKLTETLDLYEKFRVAALAEMNKISKDYPTLIEPFNKHLVSRGLFKVEENVLDDLFEKEMITPKLNITLRDQFEQETEKLEA